MPGPSRRAACLLLGCSLLWLAPAPGARGQQPASGPAAEAALPPEVVRALARQKLPADALVVAVEEVGAGIRPRLAWQVDRPVNPASLMKLLTTAAGLELLGPAWRWSTPVWLDGRVDAERGVLEGNVVIKGSGDPTLVLERLWLLLRRIRQAGVREIRGDIVLDRSVFRLPPHDPGAFDSEPYRPSNVGPDALLFNYRAIVAGFLPDPARGTASVTVDLPLAGVTVDASVPLSSAACDDWQGGLRADFSDPMRLRFAGSYPVACGEKRWPIAYADPAHYEERALAGLWQEMGGRLGGVVRMGSAPARPPDFESASPPLADVVRDINKFSNNLMAQQLFLTLGLVRGDGGGGVGVGGSVGGGGGSSSSGSAGGGFSVGTPEAARGVIERWAVDRLGAAATAGMVIDNGSGLSRDGRVSARLLARLLQVVSAGPLMPEWIASLPITGIDGTLRRSAALLGRAHLKTGSLRDVSGIAGIVLADSGRRYAVVAVVNHPDANRARPVFEALIQWAAGDAGRETASPTP